MKPVEYKNPFLMAWMDVMICSYIGDQISVEVDDQLDECFSRVYFPSILLEMNK